ncbi:MAG: hypothetical protein JXB46_02805, partial [Candidatus Eisenbacteria bacterium]|nr:hypothetical protein [Candidatus Eisenbacteria bacterium]
CFGVILEGLTATAEELEATADIDFALDRSTPSPDRVLEVPPGDAPRGEADLPGSGMEEVRDLFESLHLGDGLPVVPPTARRLEAMLAYSPWSPDTVLIASAGPNGADVTVRDVAVNAVLAGCRPHHIPILLAAFRAMADPRYSFLQSVTTSHPGGNLVLVSGPLAAEAGISGGQGCLGPGYTANATVGRAVNLTIVDVCRSVPGVCDLGCLGSQAEYSYCFAEDPRLTPWTTINAERFDSSTTVVYVLKAEPPHDVIDYLSMRGEDLMVTLAGSCTTLGSNNAYLPGNLVLVLTPDHARLLARDGWDKGRIRRHIHDSVRHSAERVRGRGIVPVRPPGFDGMDPIPVTRSPDDVEVVVAGGRGGHSAVILPWALHSDAVVEPVLLPDGRVPASLEEFRR